MGDRDRSPRRGGGGRPRAALDRRVFVNNLPFEAKWQDVKDLFRKEVGEVAYVKVYEVSNISIHFSILKWWKKSEKISK